MVEAMSAEYPTLKIRRPIASRHGSRVVADLLARRNLSETCNAAIRPFSVMAAPHLSPLQTHHTIVASTSGFGPP